MAPGQGRVGEAIRCRPRAAGGHLGAEHVRQPEPTGRSARLSPSPCPATGPDPPDLVEAFGGHREALSGITLAYMRVHYGDRPVTFGELARLRRDYDQVRSAEQETEA